MHIKLSNTNQINQFIHNIINFKKLQKQQQQQQQQQAASYYLEYFPYSLFGSTALQGIAPGLEWADFLCKRLQLLWMASGIKNDSNPFEWSSSSSSSSNKKKNRDNTLGATTNKKIIGRLHFDRFENLMAVYN
jgi:hypothetical protein